MTLLQHLNFFQSFRGGSVMLCQTSGMNNWALARESRIANDHRCARGIYSLLMSRLSARICTPPRREKYTPPPQINSHTPKESWKNVRNFFSINFTHQLYFYNKINWNQSIFKKFACGGQYFSFTFNSSE